MEKLKLSELDKYCLLQNANCDIVSQGTPYHYFISPYDCDRIKFVCGAFSKKNGARVEVVYSYRNCTIKLLWHYVSVKHPSGICENFQFVPKALTIDREFKNSILISIVPEFDGSRYRYQSLKSIYDLCEEDSEEGDAVDEHAGVCLAEVDDDSTHSKKNENVTL